MTRHHDAAHRVVTIVVWVYIYCPVAGGGEGRGAEGSRASVGWTGRASGFLPRRFLLDIFVVFRCRYVGLFFFFFFFPLFFFFISFFVVFMYLFVRYP